MKKGRPISAAFFIMPFMIAPFIGIFFTPYITVAILFGYCIMVRLLLGPFEISRTVVPILTYFGAIILLFYLMECTLFSGMFPIYHEISESEMYVNMIAMLTISLACVGYGYESESNKVQLTGYLLSIAISILAVAIHQDGQILFYLVSIPILLASCINPKAYHIKRLIKLFFIQGFMVTNLSLLFGYTKVFSSVDVHFSLETSIMGELLLCSIGVYVSKKMDEIPQDIDMDKVRLCTLRKRCRQGLLLTFSIIVGTFILECLEKKDIKDLLLYTERSNNLGIFTNTWIAFVRGANKHLLSTLDGNIFGRANILLGPKGVIGILILCICLLIIYLRCMRNKNRNRDIIDWIVLIGFIQMVMMPVCVELLPMYGLCFCLVIDRTMREKHEQSDKGECRIEESKS